MSAAARTLITSTALIVAVLSLPRWADTALAGSPPESTVIQYRDLDLSTDAGVRALYERIKRAAHHVCFVETSAHPGIDQQALYSACYQDAVADAVKQLGQERLAALHRAQSRVAAN